MRGTTIDSGLLFFYVRKNVYSFKTRYSCFRFSNYLLVLVRGIRRLSVSVRSIEKSIKYFTRFNERLILQRLLSGLHGSVLLRYISMESKLFFSFQIKCRSMKYSFEIVSDRYGLSRVVCEQSTAVE